MNIAYGEDIDRARSVLAGVADDFANDPDYSQAILEKPVMVGPIVRDDWIITMRVMVKTEPDRLLEINRELQARVLQVCTREGISLSYPPQDVWAQRSKVNRLSRKEPE